MDSQCNYNVINYHVITMWTHNVRPKTMSTCLFRCKVYTSRVCVYMSSYYNVRPKTSRQMNTCNLDMQTYNVDRHQTHTQMCLSLFLCRATVAKNVDANVGLTLCVCMHLRPYILQR